MKLVDNWKYLVKKAWSMRFMALCAVLIGFDAALPFFAPKEPSRAFAVLAGVSAICALFARLVPQKGITDGNDK